MNVEIQWNEPIALKSLTVKDISRVREQLDKQPGIYVFARRWGSGFEALYVGQAQNMLVRITQQLNNRGLIEHVLGSRTGAKMLLTGYLTYSGFTNIKKSLNTAERAYIRYCVLQRYALHNKLGTRIKTDEVNSTGGSKRMMFPKRLEVEA